MGCEKPGGPIIDLFVRDARLKFPPAWDGELPLPASRFEIEETICIGLTKKQLSLEQTKEVLDFFEEYEKRYFEDMQTGQCYHRPCGGAAVVQGETGIFCERCGKLPNLIPPECIR